MVNFATSLRHLRRYCLLTLLVAQVALAGSPQIAMLQSADDRPSGLLPGQSFTLLPDGRWLLLGGMTESGPITTATIRDQKSGSSVRLRNDLLFARAWHSATLLPDGRVLVVGGIGLGDSVVDRPEIFDYQAQQSELSELSFTPRSHHTATLLTDGRILVAGGVGGDGNVLNTVELIDVRNRTIAKARADLSTGRRDQTAIVLRSGAVLLYGGSDAVGSPLDYGELYDPDSDTFASTSLALGSATDHNLPNVEASIPADGAIDVPAETLISLRFSKPMEVQSIDAISVVLRGPFGSLPAKVIPAENGMLAFVSPKTGLQPATTYRLVLNGPRDRGSLALPYKEIIFTTADVSHHSHNDSASGNTRPAQVDAENYPPRLAPPGITAVSGQVLQLDHKPLAHVTLQIGTLKTETDETGRFLLSQVPDGHQVMVIDGRTASTAVSTYGLYEDGVDIKPKQTNVLDYKIWMTALDTAHAVTIPSPTLGETIIRTPLISGLELHIPEGTVIYDHDQKVATTISITPIPVGQPPFPLPRGVQVPLYFTIQPGGAYLQVTGNGPKGARVFYPNRSDFPAGTRFQFWNYDADQKGWYVYGLGSVTPDRTEVVPDPGVVIYEFTGAMYDPHPPGPPPPSGPPSVPGPPVGDPVDASTGLFVLRHADFNLPDVIPLTVQRTYRQGDIVSRDFGLGTTLNYNMYLTGDRYPWTYAELILPDGGRVHYDRISTGTSWTDAVYLHTGSPGPFKWSTLNWNNVRNGWDLHFTNGTLWAFPESSSATSPAQAALLFIQDRYGNTLTINRAPSTSLINQITTPNGRWVQFTYDTCSRITQAKDNAGRLVSYSYDSNTCTGNSMGRLHTVTDPLGGITTYNYQGTSPDQMTSITDARQITYVQNSYDANNRISQQRLANGGTYLFSYLTAYNGAVTRTTVTDPNGIVHQFNFTAPGPFPTGFQTGGYLFSEIHALGKPEQQTFSYDLGAPANNPANLVNNITDSMGRKTSYLYDSKGNVTSATQLWGTANASTTTYTYEPLYNRISSITDPMNNTTTFTYNDVVNQITVTDPLGNNWITFLNSAGQLASMQNPAGSTWQFSYSGGDLSSVTDPLSNTTTYAYDGSGRLTSVTDPVGEATTYSYDGLNNLLTITDALNEVAQYAYDLNSNLTTVTDPVHTSNPTTFLYNNMDQMYQRTDALGHSDSYQYDLNGNPICHTDRKGQISVFAYDGLNRLASSGYGAASCTSTTSQNSTSYGYDASSRLVGIVDTLSGNIALGYDNLDNLTYQSTPQGTVNYIFDSASRRTSMTVNGQSQVTYGYDAASRLQQVAQGTSAVNITYDNVGRRSSLAMPNGIIAQYSYDLASELTGITYQTNGATLGNLSYSYDQLGRRTQVGGSYANTNLPGSLSSAVYNAANQVSSWGGTALAYDLNGNVQSDGTNSYTWDLRNQLSAVSGGSTASFQYDGLRRRVSKTVGSLSAAFLYDNWNVVQELSGSTPTANLLTGLRPDEVFARADSSGPAYFLSDGLGSTVALASSAATVGTMYAYDPYGNTSAAGPTSTNAFQYTGRENDGTGLYFYRSRYFSPAQQRFVSEDPAGFAGGINLFAYASGNPTTFTDPFGLKPDDGTPDGTKCPGPNPGGPGGSPNGQGGGPGGQQGSPGSPSSPSSPPSPSNPLNVGLSVPGFSFGYSLDEQHQTLDIKFGVGLSTGMPGGSMYRGSGGKIPSPTLGLGPLKYDLYGNQKLGPGTIPPLFKLPSDWPPSGSYYPWGFSLHYPLWPSMCPQK